MALRQRAESCPASGVRISARRCRTAGSPRAASRRPARCSTTSSAGTRGRRADGRAARRDRRAHHGAARRRCLRFGGDLHVLPDFHGNRSPLAEPHARGVISGLTLDTSFDSLCRLYWRTCVGIALGVRHILDHMNENGYRIDKLHVTGGHTQKSAADGALCRRDRRDGGRERDGGCGAARLGNACGLRRRLASGPRYRLPRDASE